MKRSAAPSVLGSASKRATFSTPWSTKCNKISSDDTDKEAGRVVKEGHSSVLQSALLSLRQQTDHTPSLEQPTDRHSIIVKPTSNDIALSTKTSSSTTSAATSVTSFSPLPSSSSSMATSKMIHKFTVPSVSSSFVSPLTSASTPLVNTAQSSSTDNVTSHYYKVMWCKLTKKKHKTWEGDAILVTWGRSVTLKDMEGKE
ncbi:PREDICTED: DNA repair and recombination protein RAD54B-like [Amphimedon queenslandica]|uniref:DUF2439 domain-containing protein n=1 Tax=Amphimedon queenslandica TaxID=400682 RepID=A0A1X7T425_AMPQE|nr:PREDICTED: DNA repair and recombination protein RAD54B-like [Amphimedon queenslandica]|eukprot:XP_019861493.1 PREDICTED: DNA repair and recombination protein RAD54B-like [Amphimedon queenslandica]